MSFLTDDALISVFSHVNAGSTFKSVLTTCKQWNLLILKVYPNGRIIFANHLITLLKLQPDKNWDYTWLSENPSITWQIVKNNPNRNWNYNYLSHIPSITWEIVKANPDKNWNYRH